MKKKIVRIGAFVAAIVIAILVILLVVKKEEKAFDLDFIKTEFLRFYGDDEENTEDATSVLETSDGVIIGEDEEEGNRFEEKNDGIVNVNDGDEVLILKNFDSGDEVSEDVVEPMFILVVNSGDLDKYYEEINNYLVSNTENLNELREEALGERLFRLVRGAILKKEKNYLYFIMADDAELVERELLSMKK